MATLGRYEVFGLIGAGGMATVHLGRLRGGGPLARVVALKRLHGDLAKKPEHVAMLLDEARLAARIRHPNAAAMLEVFEHAGEVVLVMEYVEGETLARLPDGPIPLAIAAAIAGDVLDALHAAHEARDPSGKPLELVHRDVSPQNVLVGSNGIGHLLDFGIAKASGRSHVTRDGGVKGKVGYMAPEHLRGGALSRAADIYGLSVVLWEMLAGRHLFEGDHDAAVVVASLNGAREAPSAHVPALPAAVDDVVMRGLARLPHARFATARAMAEALRSATPVASPAEVAAWLERSAATTLREKREAVAAIERAALPPRRPWKLALAIGVATIGVGTLLIAAHRTDPPANEPPTAPEAPRAEPTLAPAPEPTEPPPAAVTSAPAARPPAVRTTRAPARNCDPPYTLEGHRKVFKPGCL